MCEERLHDPFQDQVECARYRAERDALAQRMEEIASEIDRTLSGVEGIEDAPAMRWMRGLREALGSLHAPRIGYEDLDAALWVREHGGLAEVNRKVAASMETADEYAALQCAVAELCGDLYEMLGKGDDELIDMLDKRLMPEGMEWPRFEGGEPVMVGDEFERSGKVRRVMAVHFAAASCYLCEDGPGQYYVAPGERVKRPAPKVLDADGAEIREGDTVWRADNGKEYWVRKGHQMTADAVVIGLKTNNDCADETVDASVLTHRAPVLAADGRPLREGEHVWHVETEAELVVKRLPEPEEYQAVVVFAPPASHLASFDPDQLTHERPDSWQQIDSDMEEVLGGFEACDPESAEGIRAIMRRGMALAGVSER